uniref:rRNA biogenesis protein RRP36 n=1 Tax=Erpetoichthys calabaricus TaxID=27687 RepID=A0A8C4TDP3_ERPCA
MNKGKGKASTTHRHQKQKPALQKKHIFKSKKDESNEDSTGTSDDEMEKNFQLIHTKNILTSVGCNSNSCSDDEVDTGVKESKFSSGCGSAAIGKSEEDGDFGSKYTANETGLSDTTDNDESEDDDVSESNLLEKHSISGTTNMKEHGDMDIKKELSAMSFEELIAFKNKVGTKAYDQVVHGTKNSHASEKKIKRLNKNRPMEISAKKPVPFLRQVTGFKNRTARDPRFDDLSGEYRPDIFDKTYRFIHVIKEKEKKLIENQLKKSKGTEKKDKLKHLLERMKNQEKEREKKQTEQEKELEFKKIQRERAKQGQKPFFLKKSDKRRMDLEAKYAQLKKSGRLDNFLSKKRKRNAIKDKKKLPFAKKAM